MMLTFLFLSFAALCVLRVPIAFAMLISSTVTIWLQGDVPLSIVTQRIWVGLNNFPLLAVPFFLFVGQMMNEAKISDRLVDFSRSIVGHLRGGLAHVNVVVSMIFAGISGVSSADTMGVGSVMIPAMEKEGYPKGFAVGVTAASSTLGNIIPPSLMMIIYAATAGVSVGAMFLAGIVPGILVGLGQMIWSWRAAGKLGIGADQTFSARRVVRTGRASALALLVPVIVIGGIIGGIFTATEASVVAALYAVLLAVAYREFSPRRLYAVMEDSVGLFSLSLLCVAAASLWGWLLAFYNVPQSVVAAFAEAGLLSSHYFVLIFVVLVFLVIGTFMDAIPAIIILQPIVGELAASVGIDPYHLGVVIVLTLAIGLITPPYGLCLLIAAELAKMPIVPAMRALIPFYLVSLGVVAIAVLFPDLVLWIPQAVMPQYAP
ncbi:tripartite ATP-independent transporter DctM subunit [Palleronia aestuarii]|uniref:TRAP transporter large permease protein n=1 Tax=Palleronia aestuarii TaxID=568105 RepID=A0A2W7Q642_9RHOB|nr:TRAP transporter large permease [Palleronia aestuarii]PZX17199.1 tripartite ATP-independent transporter DctM subunit [Palleronia aestuarii]